MQLYFFTFFPICSLQQQQQQKPKITSIPVNPQADDTQSPRTRINPEHESLRRKVSATFPFLPTVANRPIKESIKLQSSHPGSIIHNSVERTKIRFVDGCQSACCSLQLTVDTATLHCTRAAASARVMAGRQWGGGESGVRESSGVGGWWWGCGVGCQKVTRKGL